MAAFPEDAACADGGAAGLAAATPGARRALAPARALILDRFAALAAGQAVDATG